MQSEAVILQIDWIFASKLNFLDILRFFVTLQPSLVVLTQHYMLPSSSTLLTCSAKATQATCLVNKKARGPGPGTRAQQKVLGPWAQGPVPRTFCWALGPGPGPLPFLLTRQVAWVALAEQVSGVELEGSI